MLKQARQSDTILFHGTSCQLLENITNEMRTKIDSAYYRWHGWDVSVRLVRLEVCLSIVELKMLLQSNFLTNMGQDR